MLVRVSSPVGGLKLKNDDAVDDLYRFQKELDIAKVCTRYETQHHCERVSVESDLLFSRSTTQQEEFEHLVSRVIHNAARLANALRDADQGLIPLAKERIHG